MNDGDSKTMYTNPNPNIRLVLDLERKVDMRHALVNVASGNNVDIYGKSESQYNSQPVS